MMKKLIILFVIMLAGQLAFTQTIVEPFVTANKVQLDSTVTDSLYGSFWLDGTELKVYSGSGWTVVGSGGGGTPGGADTQIQFNDGGSFGGDADLTYNKTTNTLTTDNLKANDFIYLGSMLAINPIGSAGLAFASSEDYFQLGVNSDNLFFDASQGFYVELSNLVRMFIDEATGYVGIGTTSPSEVLHVVGSGLFTGNLSAKDTTKADIIAPDDSTAIYFTEDVRGAKNAYFDTIYVRYLGGTIGLIISDSIEVDSLFVNADLRDGAYFLVTDGSGNVVSLMDTTGYKGGGGGGTSYWSLDGTTLINDTANSDTVAVPDGILRLGSPGEIIGQVVFEDATNSGYQVTLKEYQGYILMNGSNDKGIGLGGGTINTSVGVFNDANQSGQSGLAAFRPRIANNYGFGGAYTAPEIIVNGVWETQTTATRTAFGGSIIRATGAIADNDATPSVSGADIWTYNGTATAVTITDLDDPIVGATYTIIGNSDTYTVTIADGGNFNLSAQWVGGVDDVLILYVQADNDYIELGRVDN